MTSTTSLLALPIPSLEAEPGTKPTPARLVARASPLPLRDLPRSRHYAGAVALAIALGGCSSKRSESPVGTNGPDLVLSGLSHTPVTVQAGQTVVVADSVLNQGNQPAGGFRVGIYASSDPAISSTDKLLGYRTIGGLGSRETTSGSGTLTINLTPGTWFIGAIVDDQDAVRETGEANNTLASGQLTVTPAPAAPDLIMDRLTHAPASVEQGQPVTFNDTVRNVGTAPAAAFRVAIYASADRTIDNTDIFLGYRLVGSLRQDGTSLGGGSFPIALSPGTWYIGAIADDEGSVAEANEDNNNLLSTTHGSQLVVTAAPLPDLIITALTHTPGTIEQGQAVFISEVVRNQGTAPASSFRVGIYASSDSTITTEDVLLGYRMVPSLAQATSTNGSGPFQVNLLPGTWFIGAIVDYENGVVELSETNNTMLSTTFAGQLTVTRPATMPDLVMQAMTHGGGSVQRGQPMSFSDTVYNRGNAAAGSFRVGIYASTDARITTSDTLIGYRTVGSLGTATTNGGGGSFPINLAPGTWYIGAIADDDDRVLESDETNNAMVSTSHGGQLVVTDAPAYPDLVMDALTHASASVQQGQPLSFADTVRNRGNAVAGPFRVGIYASTDNTITTADILLGYRSVSGLADGNTSGGGGSFQINLPPATYFIGAIADHENVVVESNEANNAIVSTSHAGQLTVTGAPSYPDLVMTTLTHGSATVQAGQTVSFNDTVHNQGNAPAGGFRVGIYASTNNIISVADTLLGYRWVPGLGNGNSNNGGSSFTINNLAAGTYYIGAIADYDGRVVESNVNNNSIVSTSHGGQLTVVWVPDLLMTALSHGAGTLQAPGSMSLPLSATVRNQGIGGAGAFRVGFYASLNSTITLSDVLIGEGLVGGLQSSAQTNLGGSVRVHLPPGTYYIGTWADYLESVAESDENNNMGLSASFGSQITVTGPDLIVTAVTHSAGTVSYSAPLRVDFTIRNQGSARYLPLRVGIYASSDSTITTSDMLVASDVLTLGLGSGSNYTNSRTFNVTLARGRCYYIGVLADDQDAWDETSELNNTRISSSWGGRVCVQ